MNKDDKPLLIGATLFITVVLAPFMGWPALVFSALVICCVFCARVEEEDDET